jgi:hypothetical protein
VAHERRAGDGLRERGGLSVRSVAGVERRSSSAARRRCDWRVSRRDARARGWSPRPARDRCSRPCSR